MRENETNSRMLNLEVGGFYEIECANSEKKFICQICSKTVHGNISHSYLIQYPNKEWESINPFGIYLWDVGCANIDIQYGFGYSTSPIVKCRELNEEETLDLIWEFITAGQEKHIKIKNTV